jgi:MipA family protein
LQGLTSALPAHSGAPSRTCSPAPVVACLAALGVAASIAPVRAQERPAQPLWEIGAVGIGIRQQAYPGSDEQVQRALLLPFAIYRGEFFRADNDTAGLRALKTPRFELDIGVSGAFGSSSNDIEARRGMPNLGTLVEFGPRLKVNLGPGPGGGRWRLELPLRGVFDLSDSLAHRGLTVEPELVFERRSPTGLAYSVGIGAIAADQRLSSTFYGVDPVFARPDRPAYRAEGGLLAWRLSTSASIPVGPDWRLFGFVRLDSVSGAANRASPLVRATNGVSAGFGAAYTWRRSTARAAD